MEAELTRARELVHSMLSEPGSREHFETLKECADRLTGYAHESPAKLSALFLELESCLLNGHGDSSLLRMCLKDILHCLSSLRCHVRAQGPPSLQEARVARALGLACVRLAVLVREDGPGYRSLAIECVGLAQQLSKNESARVLTGVFVRTAGEKPLDVKAVEQTLQALHCRTKQIRLAAGESFSQLDRVSVAEPETSRLVSDDADLLSLEEGLDAHATKYSQPFVRLESFVDPNDPRAALAILEAEVAQKNAQLAQLRLLVANSPQIRRKESESESSESEERDVPLHSAPLRPTHAPSLPRAEVAGGYVVVNRSDTRGQLERARTNTKIKNN